jgi:hypothetical protein
MDQYSVSLIREARPTSGVVEVQDVAILLEHVDLLDARDGGHAELLQSSLQLSVITLGGSDRLLDLLSSWGTFTTCTIVSEASLA